MLTWLKAPTNLIVLLSETLKEFKAYLLENSDAQSQIEALKSEVQAFSKEFPMPGFDER